MSASCLVVVLLSWFLPQGGLFGVDVCQFKKLTGLPCFGCGLTRSFIATAHLHLGRALAYHPLGLVLFPLALVLAATLPLSGEQRERLVGWTRLHRVWVNRGGAALLVFFIGYGLLRIFWLLVTHQRSIW
jgi:hypothetical protein